MVEIIELGRSINDVPLNAEVLAKGTPTLHLWSGIHGDEPEAVDFLTGFWKEFLKSAEGKLSVLCFPVINPDGLKRHTRVNANSVDLNRNFPSKNWKSSADDPKNNPGQMASSEPETRAMIAAIDKFPPVAIVTIHTWVPQVNYDGPGKELASVIAKKTGYPTTEHIGYPTPGSLGAYAGAERGIPVITLELPEHVPASKSFKKNAAALFAAIEYLEKHE